MKKTNINLIPDCVNPSSDYYCTWQTQLYATCDGKPKGQRAVIGEKALFDNEKPFGWAHFYEKARLTTTRSWRHFSKHSKRKSFIATTIVPSENSENMSGHT